MERQMRGGSLLDAFKHRNTFLDIFHSTYSIGKSVSLMAPAKTICSVAIACDNGNSLDHVGKEAIAGPNQ